MITVCGRWSVVCFLVAATWGAGRVRGDSIIATDFGAGSPGYLARVYSPVTGPTGAYPVGGDDLAVRFTVNGTGTFAFDSAAVPLSHESGLTDAIAFELVANSGSLPGLTVLEVMTALHVNGPLDTLYTVSSVSHPLLKGGSTYWLVGLGQGDARIQWDVTSLTTAVGDAAGRLPAGSDTWAPYGPFRDPAYRITGTAVPEPGTLILAATAILLAAALRCRGCHPSGRRAPVAVALHNSAVVAASVLIQGSIAATSARAGFELFVSDTGHQRIAEVDSLGHVITFASIPGAVIGGIAFDATGNLYVGVNDTIHRYSPTGQDLGTFITNTVQPGFLAFDSLGYLYITSPFGHDIFRYSSIGAPAGTAGLDVGVFADVSPERPEGMAVSGSTLYVGYYDSVTGHQVHRFSTSNGSDRGIFFQPTYLYANGVVFGPNGDLFVTDTGDYRVLEVSPSGTQVRQIDTSDGNPGGLAVDIQGNLYITGYGSGTVEVAAPGRTGTTNFATGFSHPSYLAIRTTPEPSSLILAGTGLVFLAPLLLRRTG